ncbi:MAG: hypothetical protein FD153_10 [Rhodospirillaceae bacterium]|nr:MAG: hypothetical protein FD153_10 [Rhodospirillaceae bacterium]
MYSTGNGLRHYVTVYGQRLAYEMDLPKNTKGAGNEGPIKAYGINGSLEIVARVNEDIRIADGKKLTITLEHSDTGDKTKPEEWATLGTLYTLTAGGGNGSLKKDTELDRFPLKSTVKRYLRAQIETDDAAASGKLDILPVYLPR